MKQEILNCIKTRRSIRSFQEKQVPQELLDAVLEAGLYAPSGMNRQPVVLIAAQKPETVEALVRLNGSILGREGPYYGAPTILLALADPAASTCVEDGSCALENMMLAAHALGLGSCWIHRAREMFETEEGKALLRQWGLPENLRGIGGLALGYPKGETPEAKPRRENRILKI